MIVLDYYMIAGWIGGVFLLVAYLLLSAKKIKFNSIIYNVLNVFGGLGLIASTFATKSWPSMTLNIIWVGIAIYAILKIRKTKPVYKELK